MHHLYRMRYHNNARPLYLLALLAQYCLVDVFAHMEPYHAFIFTSDFSFCAAIQANFRQQSCNPVLTAH